MSLVTPTAGSAYYHAILLLHELLFRHLAKDVLKIVKEDRVDLLLC